MSSQTASSCDRLAFGIAASVMLAAMSSVFAVAPPQRFSDRPFAGQILVELTIATVPASKAPNEEIIRASATKAFLDELARLEKAKRAKTLARPNLVTLNGQQASFMSGSEAAVPVPFALRNGIEFEEFGSKVEMRPTVLRDGRVHLDVAFTVHPGEDRRSPITGHRSVELTEGQSLVFTFNQAKGKKLVVLLSPRLLLPEPVLPTPEQQPPSTNSANLPCPEPPDEARILRALPPVPRREASYEILSRADVQIVTELVSEQTDPPRYFPQVGLARLQRCHWKCMVYCNETIESGYPFSFRITRPRTQYVYLDLDSLHPVANDASANLPADRLRAIEERLKAMHHELERLRGEIRSLSPKSSGERQRN